VSAEQLASTEAARLVELEETIERGLETFIEVGLALIEIREGKLYRESHRTFPAYVRERWGFSGRRARQLMQAAKVGTMVPVSNERQARAFGEADEKMIRHIWTEAQELAEETGSPITAAVIEEAGREITSRRRRQENALLNLQPSPAGNYRGSAKRLPPERIPAALAAHDQIKAESDAIRTAAGLVPLPESATVAAWRQRLNGNGNTRDPLDAVVDRIKRIRDTYPAGDHDAFDEAIAALRRVSL